MVPAALLAISLTLVLLSTAQRPLVIRTLLLVAAVSLLGWVAHDVATMLIAAKEARNLVHEVSIDTLTDAIRANRIVIDNHLSALLAVFLSVAAVLAIVGLAALTPGQAVERVIRPTIFAILGSMLGAGAALTLVALGFGGPVKPRVFVSLVRGCAPNVPECDIHDGDTFRVGDVSLRLLDVDAPELTQRCSDETECGRQARDHLASLIANKVIVCRGETVVRRRSSNEPPAESFGRPLVVCHVNGVDIGARMIADGYATVYRHPERSRGQGGLLSHCWLRPDLYRAHRAAAEAFEEGRFSELVSADEFGPQTVGNCPNSDNPR